MEHAPRKPYPSDVTDDEWAFVAPYLTLMRLDAPQRVHDSREVFNALRWMVHTGAQWRYLPTNFPPWEAVYQQTRRWLHVGCFADMVHDLRVMLRWLDGRADDPTAATAAKTTGRGGRYRWTAMRFAVFGIVALVLVGSGIATETALAGMSQHEYVKECKAGGGTSKRLGTHKVQCTIGSWSQVCDFNFDPPSCYTPFEVPAPTTTNGPRGPLAGGTYTAAQTGSSSPAGQSVAGQGGADGLGTEETGVVVPASGVWIERVDDEEP